MNDQQTLAVGDNVMNSHPRMLRHDAPRAAGVATSSPTAKVLQLNHRAIARAYTETNISCKNLGKKFGCSRQTIQRILARMDVPRRSGGSYSWSRAMMPKDGTPNHD